MGLFHKRYNVEDEDEKAASEVLPPLPRRGTQSAGYPYALDGAKRDPERPRIIEADPPPQPGVTHPPRPAAPRASTPPPPQAEPEPEPEPPAKPKQAFGIDEAVRLLKLLRERDNASVREAVQQTLEFLHIDVAQVIDDAITKDTELGTTIDQLRREIEQHEALVLAATKQIAAFENQRTELGAAKAWLLARQREAEETAALPLVRAVS